MAHAALACFFMVAGKTQDCGKDTANPPHERLLGWVLECQKGGMRSLGPGFLVKHTQVPAPDGSRVANSSIWGRVLARVLVAF